MKATKPRAEKRAIPPKKKVTSKMAWAEATAPTHPIRTIFSDVDEYERMVEKWKELPATRAIVTAMLVVLKRMKDRNIIEDYLVSH